MKTKKISLYLFITAVVWATAAIYAAIVKNLICWAVCEIIWAMFTISGWIVLYLETKQYHPLEINSCRKCKWRTRHIYPSAPFCTVRSEPIKHLNDICPQFQKEQGCDTIE